MTWNKPTRECLWPIGITGLVQSFLDNLRSIESIALEAYMMYIYIYISLRVLHLWRLPLHSNTLEVQGLPMFCQHPLSQKGWAPYGLPISSVCVGTSNFQKPWSFTLPNVGPKPANPKLIWKNIGHINLGVFYASDVGLQLRSRGMLYHTTNGRSRCEAPSFPHLNFDIKKSPTGRWKVSNKKSFNRLSSHGIM